MNDMREAISLQDDYVLVERPPRYTVAPESQPAFLKQLADFCGWARVAKVLLVGGSTQVRLSVFDVFELGRQISRLGLRVAVVEAHDASQLDVEFLLASTKWRNDEPLQFFVDVEPALEWLRAIDEPSDDTEEKRERLLASNDTLAELQRLQSQWKSADNQGDC